MPIELADITLRRIHRVATLERSAVVAQSIPGLDGDLVQHLGRHGVRFGIDGVFHGQDGADALTALRTVQQAGEPVDFIADIVDNTYVGQVVVEQLRAWQQAGHHDEFGFSLIVQEYIEAPEPESAPVLDLQRPARQFMALANLPVIGDPAPALRRSLRELEAAVSVLSEALEPLRPLFGLVPPKSVDMQVVDIHGKPIDGVTFLFIGPDGSQHRAPVENGQLQVDDLPEGEYTIIPES